MIHERLIQDTRNKKNIVNDILLSNRQSNRKDQSGGQSILTTLC